MGGGEGGEGASGGMGGPTLRTQPAPRQSVSRSTRRVCTPLAVLGARVRTFITGELTTFHASSLSTTVEPLLMVARSAMRGSLINA